MQLFSADATIFSQKMFCFAHKKLKKTPSKSEKLKSTYCPELPKQP
jgi:hypothetical protein